MQATDQKIVIIPFNQLIFKECFLFVRHRKKPAFLTVREKNDGKDMVPAFEEPVA